jgi:hypothetical protein
MFTTQQMVHMDMQHDHRDDRSVSIAFCYDKLFD